MTVPEPVPDLTPRGHAQAVDVGGGVTMLRYPGDPLDPASWRVRHRCDRGPRGVIVWAPTLTPGPAGHVVHSTDPLTITASILCGDCGLHGFVTEGAWR